ncbi:PF14257 domain protein [Leptospira mayottensis 200901122]|uniref:PF14257 domain protein n=2 Tax=Leptospira mayottensis TaxID=1137606 RepID=A0AA87SY59_9LEPT|nr:PF14257 domain protein [Leptospira mayottensis 200901122]
MTGFEKYDSFESFRNKTLKARLTKLKIFLSYLTMPIIFIRSIFVLILFCSGSLAASPSSNTDHSNVERRLYAHSLNIKVESEKVRTSRERIQDLIHNYKGFISKSTNSNLKFKIPFASQDHFLIELRNLELVDKVDETIKDVTDPYEEYTKRLEIDNEFLLKYKKLFEEDKLPKRDRRHLLVKQHRVSLDIQKLEKKKKDLVVKTKFSDFTVSFVPVKHHSEH